VRGGETARWASGRRGGGFLHGPCLPQGDDPEGLRKLKGHLATLFAASGLSLEDTFRRFDEDGDGSVDRGEFERGLTALTGEALPRRALAALIELLDKDGDGSIDYLEFARWFGLEPVVWTALEQVECNNTRPGLAMARSSCNVQPCSIPNNAALEQGELGLVFAEQAGRAGGGAAQVIIQSITPGSQAARAGEGGTSLRVGLVVATVGKVEYSGGGLEQVQHAVRAQQHVRPLELRFTQPEVVVTFREPGGLGMKFTDFVAGQFEVQAIVPGSQAAQLQDEGTGLCVGLVLVAVRAPAMPATPACPATRQQCPATRQQCPATRHHHRRGRHHHPCVAPWHGMALQVGGAHVAGMTYQQVLEVIRGSPARPLTLRFNKLADFSVSFEEEGSLGVQFQDRLAVSEMAASWHGSLAAAP
jgi:hypothetical protein